jgi:curved DNA-binding protein
MEFKDYYGILDISRQATQDEIKRAYRRLARKYHPDVSKEVNSEQRFKEVQEAYEVLKDPEKRAAYDRVGSGWSAGQEFRPPPNWDAGFEFRGGFAEQNPFSDFFETLFGGGQRGFKRQHSQFSTTNKANPAEDHHAKVKIDLEDAYHGATRSISLAAPSVDTQGRVATKERTLKVKIPAGITAGKRIRLNGQGAPKANGVRGDLYLEVLFNPHRIFRAEHLDIHIELPVTPWEVALGRTVTVPTLGGNVELHIPAASQNGNKLRLKGRGLPGNPAGDQIVTLRVLVPEAKTPQARAFYERMEQEFRINPRQNLGV